LEKYGLPINTDDGVRRIIRALDLAGVELSSLDNIIGDVVIWATLESLDY
jgi:hypothetical protein